VNKRTKRARRRISSPISMIKSGLQFAASVALKAMFL
jgi:hypothetical protein